jgi:thiamine pyrophosphokinase
MYYDPGDLITSTSQSPDKALVILNTPLMKKETLKNLWSSCRYHICADGGANRLHDMWRDGDEDSRDQYVSALTVWILKMAFC